MAKRVAKTQEQRLLEEIQADLTNELHAIRPDVLSAASRVLERNVEVNSLNGIFGGKNNTYVDSIRTEFADFDDFYAQWLEGLFDTYEKEKAEYLKWRSRINVQDKASFRNVELLKVPIIQTYAEKFLARNFYKHLHQRTRMKPDESLWSVWFGYKLTYGLLIAPRHYNGQWSNDKSEIRRAPYDYWTVGHALHTGIIDPTLPDPTTFSDVGQLYNFYLSVIKRISVSPYEQAFVDKYIAYLKASQNLNKEPLLIPELRYKGFEKDHEHRLDFTILNPHTSEFTGFEISPASTHMQVEKLKDKQNKVNEELKEKWGKEMAKRNKYFVKYGITTFTFTDDNLKDIDACFTVVEEKLRSRPISKPTVSQQLARLAKY